MYKLINNNRFCAVSTPPEMEVFRMNHDGAAVAVGRKSEWAFFGMSLAWIRQRCYQPCAKEGGPLLN